MKKIFFLTTIMIVLTGCGAKKSMISEYDATKEPNINLNKNTPNTHEFNVGSLVGAYASVNRSATLYLLDESSLKAPEENTVGGVIFTTNYLCGKQMEINTSVFRYYFSGPLNGQIVVEKGKRLTKSFLVEIKSIKKDNIKSNEAENLTASFGNTIFPLTAERFVNSESYYLKILKKSDIEDATEKGFLIDASENIYLEQNSKKYFIILDGEGRKWIMSEIDSKLRLLKIFHDERSKDEREIIIPESKKVGH